MTDSLKILTKIAKIEESGDNAPEIFTMPFKIRKPGRRDPNKLEVRMKSVSPSIDLRAKRNESPEQISNLWTHKQDSIFSSSDLQESKALQLVLIKKKRPFFNKVVSIPTRFVTPQKSRDTEGSDQTYSRGEYLGLPKMNTPGPGAYELDATKRRNIEAIRVELMKNPFIGKAGAGQVPHTGLPSSHARLQADQQHRFLQDDSDNPLANNWNFNSSGLALTDDRRFQDKDRLPLNQDAGFLVTSRK
jgi:hypothetical protein